MKKQLFYFKGEAKDLSLALLKHETAQIAKTNAQLKKVLPRIKWSVAILTGVPVRRLAVKHLD